MSFWIISRQTSVYFRLSDFLRSCRIRPMKLPAISFVLLLSTFAASGEDSFPLWEKGAPGALDTADKDIPTLTVYRAVEGKASGAAMVICPGGGYGGLAPHEGKDYAIWLADHGVTGFVLKYRLGSAGYRHP